MKYGGSRKIFNTLYISPFLSVPAELEGCGEFPLAGDPAGRETGGAAAAATSA